MDALVYDGRLKLVTNRRRPPAAGGEALIQVTLAGICNTDLEIMRGYMSFRGILGHEFTGIVREAPDASLVGKRVVGEINAACGACATCLAGMPTHCTNRTTLGIGGRDGAFAQYLILPPHNLHVIPDTVPDEEAVFVEPLAAALEILEQVHIRPTHRVLVLGDGKLGLLVAQVLRLTGCELLVIGKHRDKLDILAALGIATAVAADVGARQADIVVDCTGHPSGFEAACALVRPRGTIVLKSTFHGAAPIALTPLVVDEVTIIGSRCGPFAPALRLLQQKLVQIGPMISAVYPLGDGVEAMARAAEAGVLKVLLQP